MRGLSRRGNITAVLIGLLLAPNFAASPAAETVTIEVGNFSAPEESVAWLQREIEAFRAAHPDIIVVERNIDSPVRERFQKHEEYFGNNPETVLAANVTGLDGQWSYLAPYLAERGLIVPIEKLDESNDEFDLRNFYPALLDQVRFEGKTWAVPWLAWDCVLVIDTEIFAKAGITSAPQSWDEFLDVAKRLTQDTNGDGEIDQWGLGFRSSDEGIPDLLLTLVIQQGGRFTREGKFDSSDPAIEGTIRFMSNLASEWGIAKADPRSLANRLADPTVRYAMHLEPNHTLGDAIAYNWLKLAPIPSFDGRPKNFGIHRLYFAVRNSTKEQEKASWEFVKWMSRPDISLPDVLAGFPLRRDFTARADYRNFMTDKIQNSELIFTSCEYGYFEADRVVNLAPAMERYWTIIVPSFTNTASVPIALTRAQDSANAFLGDWYPNDSR